MDEFKPVTDVRIKAFQFKDWNQVVSSKYPMRYVIEDDALGKGHHELWVEKSKAWCTIMPGDWVALESDGVGYYPITAKEFQEKYEPAR